MPEKPITTEKTSAELVERVYLGDGYYHHFRNVDTQEDIYVPCEKEEYNELASKNIQPQLENHVWVSSVGGSIKVDTQDGRLGENEYCTINESEVFVKLAEKELYDSFKILPKESVVDNKITIWQ